MAEYGCTDGGCLFRKHEPGEMVTNGGCKCVDSHSRHVHHMTGWVVSKHKARALVQVAVSVERAASAAKIEELESDLTELDRSRSELAEEANDLQAKIEELEQLGRAVVSAHEGLYEKGGLSSRENLAREVEALAKALIAEEVR